MTEPVSETVAKEHLRVEDDDPGIGRLSAVITAARQAVERYLNASIVIQERSLTLDAFPPGDIVLPDGPVISITSIAYTDTNGDAQTVASSKLTNYRMKDVLSPAFGASWPSARSENGAVTITYQAGMMTGESPDILPSENIIAGILLTLGDLWENRETNIIGTTIAVNPTTERLLHFYRRDLGT